MSKYPLAIRNRNPIAKRGGEVILLLILAGVIIYLLLKARTKQSIGSYQNTETWDLEWSKDGLPTKVTIHRDARTT